MLRIKSEIKMIAFIWMYSSEMSLQPQLQVAGERLSQFAEVWKSKGASPDLLKLIKQGHCIHFAPC